MTEDKGDGKFLPCKAEAVIAPRGRRIAIPSIWRNDFPKGGIYVSKERAPEESHPYLKLDNEFYDGAVVRPIRSGYRFSLNPDELRHIDISEGRYSTIIITSLFHHLQLWNPEKYARYFDTSNDALDMREVHRDVLKGEQ